MCKEYNGWSNYPTWAVKLWLDNEEVWYNAMLTVVSQAKTAENPVAFLSERLEHFCERVVGLQAPASGMTSDVFGWAIEQINWREIAKAYLED
jgi:hypothetical protein